VTSTPPRHDAFKNRCVNAARTLSPCVGYYFNRISLDALAEDDVLEITLREGLSKPDVVISLSNLYYVSIAKPVELSGCFIDAISLIHLPKMPSPWPEGAADRVGRFEELGELAWLRISGLAEVDVVASIVTIYTAMSDNEAESPQQIA
jgi:hypothetical protein